MKNTFIGHFCSITDPRIDRCKRYGLTEIIFLSITAVISGAEGWEDIEDFGHTKLDWLRQYFPFKEGIPQHDTIRRVISRLKPVEIEASFQSWVSSIVEKVGADIISVDGKAARGSFKTAGRKNGLHAVSAWSNHNKLVLGQVAVNKKSNEITAIPELLQLLDIENVIITLDAMGCQRKIAQQIIYQNADYILALKGNQSGMQAELEAWWHMMEREGFSIKNHDEYTDIDSGHGRIETRHCRQLLIDTEWLDKKYRWSGLTSVIKVSSEVIEKTTNKKTQETRWYISSLPLDAKLACNGVRFHWGIESMHWILDMTFREDESLIRKGSAPLAFNVMRKIALNLFKQDKTKKASISRKKKMAALDDDFRSSLLEIGVKML